MLQPWSVKQNPGQRNKRKAEHFINLYSGKTDCT